MLYKYFLIPTNLLIRILEHSAMYFYNSDQPDGILTHTRSLGFRVPRQSRIQNRDSYIEQLDRKKPNTEKTFSLPFSDPAIFRAL